MFEMIVLFFISFIANTLSALVGGGGALLQLPAIIFMGLPFTSALVTHKIASVALGAGASIRYFKQGHFEWRLLLLLSVVAVPGVYLGAKVIVTIPTQLAMVSLGVLTISLGGYSFIRPELGLVESRKNNNLLGYFIASIVVFFIAFLNGSLTSGTGIMVTLWLVYWFGLTYKHAVSYTLIMVGLLWNTTGALTLATTESIYWSWLVPLLIGSLLGGYYGVRIANKQGNRFIKRLFEVMTICSGLALLIKAF